MRRVGNALTVMSRIRNDLVEYSQNLNNMQNVLFKIGLVRLLSGLLLIVTQFVAT